MDKKTKKILKEIFEKFAGAWEKLAKL